MSHVLEGILRLPPPLALILVFALPALEASAVIGDSVGYVIGQRYGERLLARIPNRILKAEHVQRTEDSIRRLGGKAVFVGRFTAALRALVSGMAGMSRMGYRTFLPWNALGGTTWRWGSWCWAISPAASTG